MIPGAIREADIDIDRAVEFTGDDVDRYSKLVDLGKPFEYCTVTIPTIDSATVSLYTQNGGGIDEVPLPLGQLDGNATGHFLQATTAGTGGLVVTFKLGGKQFVRIKTSADMTADRKFYIQGYDHY